MMPDDCSILDWSAYLPTRFRLLPLTRFISVVKQSDMMPEQSRDCGVHTVQIVVGSRENLYTGEITFAFCLNPDGRLSYRIENTLQFPAACGTH